MHQLINLLFFTILISTSIVAKEITPELDFYNQTVNRLNYDLVITENDEKSIHITKSFNVIKTGNQHDFSVFFEETNHETHINKKREHITGVLAEIDTFTDIKIKNKKEVTIIDFDSYKNAIKERYKKNYPNNNLESELDKNLNSSSLEKTTKRLYKEFLHFGFNFWNGKKIKVGGHYKISSKTHNLNYYIEEKEDSFDLIFIKEVKEEYLNQSLKKNSKSIFIRWFSRFFNNYKKTVYRTVISKDLQRVLSFHEIKEIKIATKKTLLLHPGMD